MTTNTQTTETTTTVYQEPVNRPVGRLPIGVAILAILIGIVGVFFLIVGLLALLFGGYTYFHGYLFGGIGIIGGLITLIIGIILIAVAGGLWNQELWALALAILVLAILLVWNLYDLFVGAGASLLSIAIEVILLIYLVAVSGHFD